MAWMRNPNPYDLENAKHVMALDQELRDKGWCSIYVNGDLRGDVVVFWCNDGKLTNCTVIDFEPWKSVSDWHARLVGSGRLYGAVVIRFHECTILGPMKEIPMKEEGMFE